MSKAVKEGLLEKDTSELSFEFQADVGKGGSGVGGSQGKNTKEGTLGRESKYKSMLSPHFPALVTRPKESNNAEVQDARGGWLSGKGLGHNMSC